MIFVAGHDSGSQECSVNTHSSVPGLHILAWFQHADSINGYLKYDPFSIFLCNCLRLTFSLLFPPEPVPLQPQRVQTSLLCAPRALGLPALRLPDASRAASGPLSSVRGQGRRPRSGKAGWEVFVFQKEGVLAGSAQWLECQPVTGRSRVRFQSRAST